MYLFNIGPEVVNPAGDGAGNVAQPHLLLLLLTFLHLLLFNMVTCTCAHELQSERLFYLKSKLNFSLLHIEQSLALDHVVKTLRLHLTSTSAVHIIIYLHLKYI